MTKFEKKNISGWGRNLTSVSNIYKFNREKFKKQKFSSRMIARGLGRSYGDSSIQPKLTIEMKSHNKIIFLDKKNSIIKVESGICISDLLNEIVEKGFFLPVTPGSKYVTVGGMVASNVHGKNHHLDGGFGNFVKELCLIDYKGKIRICSKNKNKKLFEMTIGGMGLTGIISEVTFSLIKIETPLIIQEKVFTNNLSETMKIFEKSKTKYIVAWLDFNGSNDQLGKSIIFKGIHAKKRDVKKYGYEIGNKTKKNYIFKFPFEMPFSILNYYSISVFNYLYFNLMKYNKRGLTTINKFFYPLDSIYNWNLIYGKKGFIQYQFVVPKKKSKEAIQEIVNFLMKKKLKPFLPVLKLFKKKDYGIFSFPINGYTLALDFPNNEFTLDMMNELDKIVIKYKGRIYLTKDSRINKKNFTKMYAKQIQYFIDSKLTNFKIFSSLQSQRLIKK